MKTLLRLVCLFVTACSVMLFTACSNGGSGGNSDTTPPAKITLTGLAATTASITFTWTDPSDSDFDHLEIICTSETDSTEKEAASGTETFSLTSLDLTAITSDTLYKFSVKSADKSGNLSGAAVFFVKTPSAGSIIFTKISDASGLQDMANDLDGNYLLTADIDLTDVPWTAIGDDTNYFCGVLNGNGHSISGLTVISTDDYQGLFGYIEEGAISGLKLTDMYILGGAHAGGLAGSVYSSTICDCHAAGDATGIGLYAGGLAGDVFSSTISGCSVTGDITGGDTDVGGLVGYCDQCDISGCYAAGEVTGADGAVGGLAGNIAFLSTISCCYATANVKGAGNYIGGMVGILQTSSTITDCYAAGNITSVGTYFGGLAGGCSSSTASNSFYDTDTTGMSDTGNGTPMATEDMKDIFTFTSLTDSSGNTRTDLTEAWDFTGTQNDDSATEDIWAIDSSINGGYPYLTALEDTY